MYKRKMKLSPIHISLIALAILVVIAVIVTFAVRNDEPKEPAVQSGIVYDDSAIEGGWETLSQEENCGIRVRISDGELLRKITLLMNRVIANADLMLPHPKVKHRDSAVVLNLQQQISDEMEQERPSEEQIATLLCEIAGQLYKETNAKAQIAAQIARKRAALMHPQDAFNSACFSSLIDAVSLHVGGGVVLHTKTETDICESEEEPNGSPENSETDSFRN